MCSLSMKILAILASAAISLSLFAADPGASPSASPAEGKPGPEKPAAPEPPRISVTEHSITINGQVLKYKATAGYLTLSDENPDKGGKPR